MPDPGMRLTEVELDVKTLATALTGAADKSFQSIFKAAQKIAEDMDKKIRQDLEQSASLKAQVTQGKTISRTQDEAPNVEPEIKKMKL